MVSILADLLDSNPETAGGVIFDGFPRTINQAKELKEMLAKRNSKVHAVIGLEVEDEELIDRLIKRGKESGRADDNLETIKQRLDVYHNQTSPLRDYYIAEGKYLAINGTGTIEQISATIINAVNEKVK
jgi:adenylate kinase